LLSADSPANPYQGIVDRNLFNLKALPGPGDNLPPPDPPPKIILTGITTILGDKRVLFKVQAPAKPPQPAKEESYILTEGQRDGDIEVLEIDEKAGVAKFNNHGTMQTLDLVNDSAKLPGVPAAAAGPPPPRPMPPLMGHTLNGPQPGAGARGLPTRTLRLPEIPGTPVNRMGPGRPGMQVPNAPR